QFYAVRLQGLGEVLQVLYLESDVIQRPAFGPGYRRFGGAEDQRYAGKVGHLDLAEGLSCRAKIRDIPLLHGVDVRRKEMDLMVFRHGGQVRAGQQLNANVVRTKEERLSWVVFVRIGDLNGEVLSGHFSQNILHIVHAES